MTEPRLTLADCHAMEPRYCNQGIRAVLGRLGLSWPEFRDRGLPFSAFEGVDDAMVQAVLDKARERLGVR